MTKQQKDELIIMKSELGLIDLKQCENQAHFQELDMKNKLPDNIIAKQELSLDNLETTIYYEIVNNPTDDIREYISVKKAYDTQKLANTVPENVAKCKSYLKFFVVLTAINLIASVVSVIIALV